MYLEIREPCFEVVSSIQVTKALQRDQGQSSSSPSDPSPSLLQVWWGVCRNWSSKHRDRSPLSPLPCRTCQGKKHPVLRRGTMFGLVSCGCRGVFLTQLWKPNSVWQGGRIALCAQLLAWTKVLCGRAKFSQQQNCYCAQRAEALPCDKWEQQGVLQGGRGSLFCPMILRDNMDLSACLVDSSRDTS